MIIRLASKILILAAILSLPLGRALLADEYPLQHRSSFQSSEVPRNPFWPIGYVHTNAPRIVPKGEAVPKISADAFAVTSILLGNPPLAVVNGTEVAVGDRLAVQGTTVQVVAILDNELVMRFQDRTISVPMRR